MTLLDERPVADEPRPASAPRGTSGTGRWRLAARLARREVRRRPWRTVLVVLLVAVPVAALVAADIAYRTDRLRTTDEFGTASVRARLLGPPASFGDDDIEAVLPPGTPYSWWYETGLPLREAALPDGMHFTTVMSIDPVMPINKGIVRMVEGRNAAGDDEITLTASTADDFGVGVGDRLALVRPDQSFTVVGIVAIAGQRSAMIAPGFDWSAVRQDARSATVLAGDEADAIDSTWAWNITWTVNGGASVEQRSSGDWSDPIALFFGWLGGTIAMGVLGIVVASAFAVSGRRQLVTIGQLSATGADASVLRRFLALQGTFSGAAGAVVGVACGATLVAALDEHISRNGRLVFPVVDIAIVAITAVVVATGAALVPARSLATTSVLTALGGRRPVAPVRPRQVRIGAMLAGGGLLVLVLCFAAENSGAGAGSGAAIALIAALAAIALLAGVCCLAPAIVAAVARAGRDAGGSLRLAIRDLERHSARSGALLAAVIVVGAGVIAIGSAVDREAARANGCCSWPSAAIIVNSYRYSDDPNVEPAPAPRVDDVAPTMRASVEAVVGPVQWGERDTVVLASDSETLLSAVILDPVLLRIDGFDEDEIAVAMAADVVQVAWLGELTPQQRAAIAADLGIPAEDLIVASLGLDSAMSRKWGFSAYYVSRSAVDRAGLPVETDPALYGLADHAVTRAEYDQLMALGTGPDESYFFTDVDPADSVQVSIQATYPQRDWNTIARWAVIGGALLLVSLVVALGLALWAAEGREERNTLVTIGAPPSTVAAMAGWKALLLAGVGGIVAVPLGYGTLRLCFLAASDWTPFPWLTAFGVVVIIPLVVGLGSVVISSIAQRTRPVRAVLASTD